MEFVAMKVALIVGIAVALVGTVNARRVVPALYVLGDSLVDVGNNNYLQGKDVMKADKPFYGVDFPGGPRPTGRFSNGYNIADFVAKNLGFERSPVAYLALKSRNCLIPDALTRGVSYASAGAGILDSTEKRGKHHTPIKAKMQAVVGSRKVASILANSFFLLDVGSNDLVRSKPQTPADVATIYTTLVSNYSADLYGMGARKFGIINVGPLGCVPAMRVLNSTGACNNDLNLYAAGFAATLKSALASLAPKLPGLAYSLGDSFAASQASLANRPPVTRICQCGQCMLWGREAWRRGPLHQECHVVHQPRHLFVLGLGPPHSASRRARGPWGVRRPAPACCAHKFQAASSQEIQLNSSPHNQCVFFSLAQKKEMIDLCI